MGMLLARSTKSDDVTGGVDGMNSILMEDVALEKKGIGSGYLEVDVVLGETLPSRRI
jgi:hypothetical protein|tara:strand:+ start:1655 stop:1825 length:171 start_codon:yes stop_codon:yes gene_type:complete